eukprot:757885-Hanusia_phi.AAC.4
MIGPSRTTTMMIGPCPARTPTVAPGGLGASAARGPGPAAPRAGMPCRMMITDGPGDRTTGYGDSAPPPGSPGPGRAPQACHRHTVAPGLTGRAGPRLIRSGPGRGAPAALPGSTRSLQGFKSCRSHCGVVWPAGPGTARALTGPVARVPCSQSSGTRSDCRSVL